MKKFSTFVAAAMVAVAVFLSASKDALAQPQPDFGQVRAAVTACANLPGPTDASAAASCTAWTALANCIVQTMASSPTCSVDAVQAEKALRGMQTTCGAASAAQVASLQAELTTCRNGTVQQPTTLPRLIAPRCLAETGAALICRDRGGRWHREDTSHACSERLRDMTRFTCACPEGSPGAVRLTYRNGRRAANTYACMGVAGHPPVITQQTESNVQNAEAADLRGLVAIRSRIDHACENFVHVSRDAQGALVFSLAPNAPANPAASDIGPTVAGADHNCALTAYLMGEVFRRVLVAGASPTVTRADLDAVNGRLDGHDRQFATINADNRVRDGRITALERQRSHSSGWQVNLFTGLLLGWTSVSDLGGVSYFSHTGVQGRYWFNHHVGVQASVGFLAGHLGAPYIDSSVGYTGEVGMAFHFETGSVGHIPELGFEVRTYTLSGFQSISNLDQLRMVGDYEGRSFGARAAWTLSFAHGMFAVTPSFSLGYGENVYGVAHRGTLNFVSGEGVEAVAGLSLAIGLGQPPPVAAPDPEPVAAETRAPAPAPAAAPVVAPSAPTTTPPQPPSPAAAVIPSPDEVPFLEGIGS